MSGKFALIIGNTEYTDPGLAQLTAPGKDAEDFARVLQAADIGAFDDVVTLLNQPEYVVREAIDDFFNLKMPEDLLVLYFSGHGVRDEFGALFLAVKNTFRNKLRATGIKSDFIREAMDHSRSRRQVLILDCCNSGAFSQGTKAATGVSIGTASAFEAGYGRIILTASDSTQFAWEGNKIIGETDNSLFTHFLVEGLEGSADRDGDGRITVDELYDYAYERVKLATPKQTPSKFSTRQQGEIVLRDNIRVEDTQPVPLPADLSAAIQNSMPFVREGAVRQLDDLLKGRNLALARSARQALEKIAQEDDSRAVARAAARALESIQREEEAEKKKASESQKKHEAAEVQRLLHERTVEAERLEKEKAEKLAAQKAEADRAAKSKREAERLAEEKRIAEEAEKQRSAIQKLDEEQRSKAKPKEERPTKESRRAREIEHPLNTEAKSEGRKAAQAMQPVNNDMASAKSTTPKTDQLERAEAQVVDKVIKEPEVHNEISVATTQQKPLILFWVIIGTVGVCIFGLGMWGLTSFLSDLGARTSTPTRTISSTPPRILSPTLTNTRQTPTIRATNTTNPTQTFTPTETPQPTRTPNIAQTQRYGEAEDFIRGYVQKGLLPNTNGTYHYLGGTTLELAQLNYYSSYSTFFSPKDFVIRTEIEWENASDTPNLTSGCGFKFRDSSDEGHYAVFPYIDGNIRFFINETNTTADALGEKTYFGRTNFRQDSIILTLIVYDTKFVALVNESVVETVYGRAGRITDGGLYFSILSGSNKDFGLRCKYQDTFLWIINE